MVFIGLVMDFDMDKFLLFLMLLPLNELLFDQCFVTKTIRLDALFLLVLRRIWVLQLCIVNCVGIVKGIGL